MNLLLKPVAGISQIIGLLCVFRQSAALGCLNHLRQVLTANFLQLLFPCQNIHSQLFEMNHVLFIQLIQQGNIAHQRNLMIFQRFGNLVDIQFRLIIASFHLFHLVRRFLKHAEQAFFFFFIRREAFQLTDQIRHHFTDFTEIFCSDILQGRIGEIRNFLLGFSAVLQYGCG